MDWIPEDLEMLAGNIRNQVGDWAGDLEVLTDLAVNCVSNHN